jgi:hypothetical protein
MILFQSLVNELGVPVFSLLPHPSLNYGHKSDRNWHIIFFFSYDDVGSRPVFNNILFISLYIYIYICVCVCVCVSVRQCHSRISILH